MMAIAVEIGANLVRYLLDVVYAGCFYSVEATMEYKINNP